MVIYGKEGWLYLCRCMVHWSLPRHLDNITSLCLTFCHPMGTYTHWKNNVWLLVLLVLLVLDQTVKKCEPIVDPYAVGTNANWEHIL